MLLLPYGVANVVQPIAIVVCCCGYSVKSSNKIAADCQPEAKGWII